VRVVALLSCVVVGAVVAGSDEKPTAKTIRVLTYNIHHGEGTDGKVDLPRLAAVIAGVKPDLVALQEVDHKTKRTGGVDQTAELARLTGLRGKFGKAIDYQGGEYGQAILSRHPIKGVEVHVLPGEPERETRIAVAAEIPLGDSGRTIRFVTTHLHHQSDEFRKRQAAKLDELFGRGGTPVIVAGDLNATPDSKPLGKLAKNWKSAEVGKPLLTFPVDKPAKQIDYVLVRPADKFKVTEARVLDEAVASDHRALLVVLELPE